MQITTSTKDMDLNEIAEVINFNNALGHDVTVVSPNGKSYLHIGDAAVYTAQPLSYAGFSIRTPAPELSCSSAGRVRRFFGEGDIASLIISNS